MADGRPGQTRQYLTLHESLHDFADRAALTQHRAELEACGWTVTTVPAPTT